MEHFAQVTLPEIATILGVALAPLAVLLLGFYKFAKTQMDAATDERKEQQKAFTDALDKLGTKIAADTKVGRELVQETRKGNKEAAERNGHLGEQNENITKLIVAHAADTKAMADQASIKIIKSLKDIKVQNVKTQNIEKSHIKDEVVEHETVKEME